MSEAQNPEDKLSQRLLRLEESSTLRMAKLSRELREKGQNPINLSLGEPDFDTPEHIKQAAIQAIQEGYTKYPPVAGFAELRKAVAAAFAKGTGVEYKAENIVVSNGAKQSIINVLLCLLEKGDEVIVPAPFWVSYPEMIKLTEASCVTIPTTVEQEFKITPEQLENAITDKTKAFLFSSPSNPTGSVYTKEELTALAEVFRRYPQVFIISDEIYEHINYMGGHVSIGSFEDLTDRIVLVNGVSKAFAMTGWRIGYIAAPVWLAKACEKIQGQFTSGASSISQRATLTALESDLGPTEEMAAAFRRRRDLVLDLIQEIPGIKVNEPQGAFYVFPNVSAYYGAEHESGSIRNAEDLCMYILQEAQVVLVPGDGFGAPQCIRLSYAASDEELTKALKAMKAALAKLKVKSSVSSMA